MTTRKLDLKTAIEDVIEDCRMFGIDKKCYIYVLNGKYAGYSLEKEHIIYIDEETIESDLFNLLVSLIENDFKISNAKFTRKMIIARAIWNIKGISLKNLSEIAKIPLITLESWNSGKRTPSLENLLNYANKVGLPASSIFNVLNAELKFNW